MSNKVALITAAGSGMGAAIARELASLDYRVAILSSSGRGESLANELGGVGITGSNQNPDDLKRLVDAGMRAFGRIDAVVNSAGHGPKGRLLEISDDDWHLAMDVYLLNVVRVARLVTPILESGEGVFGELTNGCLRRHYRQVTAKGSSVRFCEREPLARLLGPGAALPTATPALS